MEFAYAPCAYLANSEHYAKNQYKHLLASQRQNPNGKFSCLTTVYGGFSPFAANSPTSLPLGLILSSNLLGLSKPLPISPSWQYTALAVCTRG